EINLGDASMEDTYKKVTVTLNGKTLHPAPLVFYAAVLKDAPQPELANRFLTWLQGPEAYEILARYHYDNPGDAKPLTPSFVDEVCMVGPARDVSIHSGFAIPV